MFNSPVLDFFIALFFVYFLLSLLSSAVLELFITVRRWRGKMLEKSLTKVLDDKKGQNWCSHLYAHPLIEGLRQDSKRLPAYIPSNLLADAMVDVFVQRSIEPKIRTAPDGTQSIVEQSDVNSENVYSRFTDSVKALPHGEVRELLESFVTNSAGIEDLKKQIISWFDGLNDRMGGWFKNRTRIYLQYTAFSVAVIFNLNFVEIARFLWENDAVRQSLVEQAATTIENSEVSDYENLFGCDTLNNDSLRNACSRKILVFIDSIKTELDKNQLPVFWTTGQDVLQDSIENTVKSRIAALNLAEPEDCEYLCDDFDNRELCSQSCQKRNKVLEEKRSFYTKVYTYQVTKDLKDISPSLGEVIRINWKDFSGKPLEHLLGWIITAFLVSQGAPFWFKLMTRLINVRGNGDNTDNKTNKS